LLSKGASYNKVEMCKSAMQMSMLLQEVFLKIVQRIRIVVIAEEEAKSGLPPRSHGRHHHRYRLSSLIVDLLETERLQMIWQDFLQDRAARSAAQGKIYSPDDWPAETVASAQVAEGQDCEKMPS
jgi:hypothetical protein